MWYWHINAERVTQNTITTERWPTFQITGAKNQKCNLRWSIQTDIECGDIINYGETVWIDQSESSNLTQGLPVCVGGHMQISGWQSKDNRFIHSEVIKPFFCNVVQHKVDKTGDVCFFRAIIYNAIRIGVKVSTAIQTCPKVVQFFFRIVNED